MECLSDNQEVSLEGHSNDVTPQTSPDSTPCIDTSVATTTLPLKKSVKCVRFAPSVCIRLIPSRLELKPLKSQLHYSQYDFDYFYYDARSEVSALITSTRCSYKDAKKILYQQQSHASSSALVMGKAPPIKRILLLTSVCTYFVYSILVSYSKLI